MRFLTLYRREILITVFLAATYFVTRLFFILHLPIFTDEAIYIRWSQIAKQDAAWRFISLTDGKQPMFVWITMTLMKFVKDPLLAGRLTSVIAGFFSAIGLFFLGNALFKNKWVGFLSAAIYVLLPFTLVYDRMALYESLVCMFLIWGLYITILMTKRLQLYLPFIAGLIIGGGMLTKTTNFWSLYFMPFLLLLFDWRKEQRWQRFFRWVCFAVLVTALAYTYYSILRLSPYFGIIAEKNYTFYYPLNEWLHHPLVFFSGNLQGMISWLVTYINWLSILLIVFSFFVQRKLWKEKILLILWFVVPFLIFALIAKVLYPRYILYMTVFLIPLISLGVFESFRVWKQTVVGICIIVFLFASYLYVDRFILFDFAHAPIPQSDLVQFINSWPSGGGIKEANAFFAKQAQTHKIFIATEGTYGLLPEAVEMYLVNNTNVTIKGYWPINDMLPKDVAKTSIAMPTYFVFYEPCPSCSNTDEAPSNWPLKKIVSYQRGIGTMYLTVYQVIPGE